MSTTKARDNDGGSSDDSNNPVPSAGDLPRRIERIALPPGAIVATNRRFWLLPKGMMCKTTVKRGEGVARLSIRLRCVYCGSETDFEVLLHDSAHALDCPECGSMRSCVAPMSAREINGVRSARRMDARNPS